MVFIFLLPFFLAAEFDTDRIKHHQWGNIPVVYLEDARFPTYALYLYFSEGARSDHPSRAGETQAAFSLLTAGTNRYEQREILDQLDFFGATYGATVTHEYSSYQVMGLVKDIVPTMKMVCHLFTHASFPKKVVAKEIDHAVNALDNLISDHGSLASRAFRALSMGGTPYASHTDGTKKSLQRITTASLKSKLNYFNSSVGKRIYLTGPPGVLGVESIILRECGWEHGMGKVQRRVAAKRFPEKPKIYLVSVPNANQAQVRIGRYLDHREGSSLEVNALMTDFMSGGLSSKMLRELRTNRGLIYSGGVALNKHRDYGRNVIITYTRNEKVQELLSVIKELFTDAASGKTTPEEFKGVQQRLIGKYPFSFEQSASFLDHLLLLDHTGRDYSEFFNFRANVAKRTPEEMATGFRELFDWKKMTIVVLGDKSLRRQLSRLGSVEVLDYKNFL